MRQTVLLMKLQREMSISHGDFLRLLPRLLDDYNYQIEGNTVSVRGDDQRVTIILGAERERRIASLTLPVTDIEINLEGFTDKDAQAFIARFENTYRRGGG